MKRKITLYIATSSDGFIAKKDGSIAWLDEFNGLDEDYGKYSYTEFIKSIETVIMGNTTYKQILSFDCEYPYKKQKNYVFANKTGEDEHATFVSGDVKLLVEKLNENIWLVGGANITQQFLKENLIDEIILFEMPINLREGIKLFPNKNFSK